MNRKYWRFGAFLVVMGVLESGVFAQRVDFSGTWLLESSVGEPIAASLCRRECTIIQDSQFISFKRGQDTVRLRLDGEETRETLTSGPYSTDIVTAGKWSGPTLVVVRRTGSDAGGWLESHISVAIQGSKLTIEVTVPTPGSLAVSKLKAVYKRQGSQAAGSVSE